MRRINWKRAWDFLVEASTSSLIIFLTHHPKFLHFLCKNFFLSAQEYKNAICKNSLKENRTFIFAYIIIKLRKYYTLFCINSVLNIFNDKIIFFYINLSSATWSCTFHYSWSCQFHSDTCLPLWISIRFCPNSCGCCLIKNTVNVLKIWTSFLFLQIAYKYSCGPRTDVVKVVPEVQALSNDWQFETAILS